MNWEWKCLIFKTIQIYKKYFSNFNPSINVNGTRSIQTTFHPRQLNRPIIVHTSSLNNRHSTIQFRQLCSTTSVYVQLTCIRSSDDDALNSPGRRAFYPSIFARAKDAGYLSKISPGGSGCLDARNPVSPAIRNFRSAQTSTDKAAWQTLRRPDLRRKRKR